MARKSRNNQYDLPPLELQCMKALWAAGQATVQDVRDRLLPARPLAYTTVMTVMDRLARKGVVAREKRGRAHLYSPSVSEDVIRERALNHLVEDFFQGTHEQLRRYLEGGMVTNPKPGASEPPSPVKPRQVPVRSPKQKEPEPRLDASLL
jgi:BlaI family transcriptional regulator, penicillinase repressor